MDHPDGSRRRIEWRQTGSARWVGRDADGYSLRVAATAGDFRWTVRPPGAGYVVAQGAAQTREAACTAAEEALERLSAQIRMAFEERLRSRSSDGRRADGSPTTSHTKPRTSDRGMPIRFTHAGLRWELREGGPPMGCREGSQSFEHVLKAAHPPLAELRPHLLASWVVARLSAITGGLLEQEGQVFSHDTDQFGYKLKAADGEGKTLAYGAVVFQSHRTMFAWSGDGIGDFQAAFIALLTESPDDLGRCEIVVRAPESRRSRRYGWDGYSLIEG